jgi:hypothetical protein
LSFEIRAATAADAPGIRRLFERVFGKALSQEEWHWKFQGGPDGWYGVVGVVDGRPPAPPRTRPESLPCNHRCRRV